MDNEENFIPVIDEYLGGNMTPDERLAFELKISKDASLRQQVDEMRQVIEGIRSAAFRSAVGNYHKQYKATRQSKVRYLYISAIAASITLICVFSYFALNSPAHSDIASAYFTPYPSPANVRSGVSGLYASAYQHYEREEYAQAAKEFAPVVKDENAEQEKFYYAMCLLAISKPRESISLMESLKAGTYAQEVRWYQAVAYVMAGNNTDAKKLLKEIQPDQFQFAQAHELLSQLN